MKDHSYRYVDPKRREESESTKFRREIIAEVYRRVKEGEEQEQVILDIASREEVKKFFSKYNNTTEAIVRNLYSSFMKNKDLNYILSGGYGEIQKPAKDDDDERSR